MINQGWLTEQKSEVFEMGLRYFDPQKGAIPSYTGNITEWEWAHKGATADNTLNTYAFDYDGLSRLTDTRRFEGAVTDPTDAFTEQGLSYDGNGNILALQRFGAAADAPEDDFEYEYDGNKLVNLRTAANPTGHTYEYDSNGNMTKDGLNSLQLEYNFLNLTGKVSDMSGNALANYSWLADGTKTGVRDATGTSGYEYIGSLVYKYVNGELQLESAGFGGGRIIASEGSNGAIYEPHYFITDHLGSTRAIVKPNATSESGLEVLERNDYLPFGMKWQNPNALISDNRWLYNGKELQTVGLPAGVHFLDYGARVYDPEIIRLKTQDKLATQYYSTSPYAYVGNNPTKYLDVGGNFRLSADFVKQYPRLANYLRYDIQDILNNPTIMSALQKHGELTEDQIKADLTWGQGPEINVVSAGSGGLFIPGSSRLNIISDWVSYLEEATGLSKEATLFIVGTILLHEYVHYGDDQDDVPRGEYPVELFEKAAYGQQISGMKNAVEIATKIWKDWYDRQEQAKEQAKDNFQEDTQTYSDDDIFSGNVPEGTYTWNGSGWERQY